MDFVNWVKSVFSKQLTSKLTLLISTVFMSAIEFLCNEAHIKVSQLFLLFKYYYRVVVVVVDYKL